MEPKAATKERAKVAQGIVTLMLEPAFGRRLEALDFRDADGGVPIIAAGPDESAVVTMHRIEQSGNRRTMLASMRDGRIRICSVEQRAARPDLGAGIEVIGGTTVWEWMNTITGDEAHAATFYSSGSDVMSALSMMEYAV